MLTEWLIQKLKAKKLGNRSPLDLKTYSGKLVKDAADERDYLVSATLVKTEVPEDIDLREWAPPVKNQLSLGSCGSNAFISSYELLLKKNHPEWYIEGSEIYHYYFVRKLMGTFPNDSGQTLREGAKTLVDKGFCPEALSPYNVSDFNKDPTLFATSFAQLIFNRKLPVKRYSRAWSIEDMKQALANSLPVIFGMKIYSNFFSHRDGIYKETSGQYKGGHAMLIVGYSKRRNSFLVLNSWGKSWGMTSKGYQGYCWIDCDTLSKQLIDAWTIEV